MTRPITRRSLLAGAAAAPLAAMAAPPAAVKPGIDLFSIRSQNWTPFQYLDYCAAHGAKVVHFSEIRFIGNLEPDNLRKVRQHAEELGIEVEIGMKSICPTSKMFEPKDGTAEEQIARMMAAAKIVGSRIVRCVLGSSDDRVAGPIERHIESTVKVLRNVRPKLADRESQDRHRESCRRHAGARVEDADRSCRPGFRGRLPRFGQSAVDHRRPALDAGHAASVRAHQPRAR